MIDAWIYTPPNGKKSLHTIKNVYEEDAIYINNNDVVISMEEVGGKNMVYATHSSFKEHEELIECAGQRSCHDTIASLMVRFKPIYEWVSNGRKGDYP